VATDPEVQDLLPLRRERVQRPGERDRLGLDDGAPRLGSHLAFEAREDVARITQEALDVRPHNGLDEVGPDRLPGAVAGEAPALHELAVAAIPAGRRAAL
jgi:hypothetical protein